MFADRRVKSCNVASAVSMDCVVTNTSRDARAMGAGQVAAKTGETKAGETRIAVAANSRPMGLGIVRVPTSSQVAKNAKARLASARRSREPRSPPRRHPSHRPAPTLAENDKDHVVRHQQRRHPERRYPIGGPHVRRRAVNGGKRNRKQQVERALDVEERDERPREPRPADDRGKAMSASTAAMRSPKAAG